MNTFELPALEYCSLDRAARLIGSGCEVGDLLHWAEIGAIKLAKQFLYGKDDFTVGFYFENSIDEASTLFLNTKQLNDYHINISKFSILETTLLENCETLDEISSVLTNYDDKPRITATPRGVWCVSDFYYDRRRSDPYINSKLTPLGESKFNVYAQMRDDIGISKDDLLISKNDIEIILGRSMQSLISGGLTHPQDISIAEDDRKTVARNRAGFIKALLYVHYGEDAAEKPKKFIDDNVEIREKFKAKNLKLPSGKTIENWLKDSDFDML
ncbi:hypothetical protein V6478_003389 [Providencia rettgeri]